ncbi:hypothetical protein MFIFM68171_10587 [Madurella fahalii]|uniref:Uncharacterized protein n=1 Tax=Madurella fahalii TaxID=1157608 RepID=A0ABQ0GRM9_9PEZI
MDQSSPLWPTTARKDGCEESPSQHATPNRQSSVGSPGAARPEGSPCSDVVGGAQMTKSSCLQLQNALAIPGAETPTLRVPLLQPIAIYDQRTIQNKNRITYNVVDSSNNRTTTSTNNSTTTVSSATTTNTATYNGTGPEPASMAALRTMTSWPMRALSCTVKVYGRMVGLLVTYGLTPLLSGVLVGGMCFVLAAAVTYFGWGYAAAPITGTYRVVSSLLSGIAFFGKWWGWSRALGGCAAVDNHATPTFAPSSQLSSLRQPLEPSKAVSYAGELAASPVRSLLDSSPSGAAVQHLSVVVEILGHADKTWRFNLDSLASSVDLTNIHAANDEFLQLMTKNLPTQHDSALSLAERIRADPASRYKDPWLPFWKMWASVSSGNKDSLASCPHKPSGNGSLWEERCNCTLPRHIQPEPFATFRGRVCGVLKLLEDIIAQRTKAGQSLIDYRKEGKATSQEVRKRALVLDKASVSAETKRRVLLAHAAVPGQSRAPAAGLAGSTETSQEYCAVRHGLTLGKSASRVQAVLLAQTVAKANTIRHQLKMEYRQFHPPSYDRVKKLLDKVDGRDLADDGKLGTLKEMDRDKAVLEEVLRAIPAWARRYYSFLSAEEHNGA